MDASSADAVASRPSLHGAGAWAALPALSWTCTSDGAVTSANAFWQRYVGGDANDAASIVWTSVVHPDDRQRLQPDGAEPQALAGDVRLRRHDGVYAWHTVRLTRGPDEGGTPVWIGCALARTSTKTHDLTPAADPGVLYDALHVGTALVAAGSWRIVRSNRTFAAIAARRPDDLHGHAVAELAHPDDVARLETAVHRLSHGALDTYDAEQRWRRPDGEVVWVRVRAAAAPSFDGAPADVALMVDDITARKAVESALALSEERLRLATASAGIATFDYDVVADRAYWSPELYAMLGVTAGDATATQAGFLEHVHPDDRERLLASSTRAMRPGDSRTVSREFRIVRRDTGEVRWISHSASVHFAPVDGELRPVRANGVLLDITERKAAQMRDALLLRLHETLRPLEDAIAVQEAAARVLGEHLGVSRVAYGEVTGDDRALEIARNFVAPGVAPLTGRFEMDDYGPVLVAALRGGQPIVVPDLQTSPILTAGQRLAYAQLGVRSLVTVPLVKNGRFVAVLTALHADARAWTAADVTLVVETAERTWAAVERSRIAGDLRESEARYRAMFDLSQVGKAELDLPAGRVLLANRALAAMTGRPASALTGRSVAELLLPDDRAEFDRALGTLAAGASGAVRTECRGVRRDGAITWMAIDATLIRDPQGRPWRVAAVVLDVSERKWAEGRLQRSEARFRTLAESAPVGIFRADVRGHGTYVNAAWLADSGVTLEEASAKDGWASRVHPDDRARVVQAWRDTVATGSDWQSEYRVVRGDGAVSWILGRAVPERDERGRVIGYVGMTMDISARKAGEQALQASAQRQALLVRVAEATRPLTDPAELTRVACGLLGAHLGVDRVSYAEIDDDGVAVIGPDYAAGGRPSLAGTYPLAQFPVAASTMARGESLIVPDVARVTAPSLRRDLVAALKVGSFVCTPVRRDGRLVGALVATSDAPREWPELELATIDKIAHLLWTSLERVRAEIGLRESEARFRLLADQTPIMLWVVADDGGTEFLNREYCAYFGVTREGMAAERWQQLIHPDDLAAYGGAFRQALTTHAPFEATARVRRADGAWRWIVSYGLPRQTETGDYLGMIGVTTDVTEARDAAEAMAQAARQKDDFIAVLAHELRNPLAPIRTTMTVLRQRETADPMLTRCYDIVERQVSYMARLLDDLLDISRLGQGKLTLQTEPLRLVDVVEAAVETARPLIDARRHTLRVAPIDASLLLHGDQVRLTQVFANLLNNAAKYTDPGGRIELSAEVRGGQVRVAVVDSGIGLASELLPIVFDPFVQGREAASRGEGGVGVGLGLARQLVELHEGVIEADSPGVGRGSTFTVTLPLLDAVPVPAGPTPAAVEAPADTQVVRRRVLVADDNVDAAETLALLLEPLGCDVRTAFDGKSALSAAREFRPELVLLDLGLPGVDGRDVCERLQAEPWATQCLFAAVTGWGQEDDRRASLRAGFHLHLVKPVDPSVLVELVQTLPPPAG